MTKVKELIGDAGITFINTVRTEERTLPFEKTCGDLKQTVSVYLAVILKTSAKL